MDAIWNALKSEAAAIGIILTILTALWTSLRALALRRQELRAQNFRTYHQLIHTLVALDERGNLPMMDVQIAGVFELQRFPAYFDLSLGILKGLREFWEKKEPDKKRLFDEMDSTIAKIELKSKTLRHCIKQRFRDFSTY